MEYHIALALFSFGLTVSILTAYSIIKNIKLTEKIYDFDAEKSKIIKLNSPDARGFIVACSVAELDKIKIIHLNQTDVNKLKSGLTAYELKKLKDEYIILSCKYLNENNNWTDSIRGIL